LANIAVIKEIQTLQAASLIRVEARLDQLWDIYQRAIGEQTSEKRAAMWWRWVISLIVALLGAVLTYRVWVRP